MTSEEMEKLKKQVYGDKPMTTENSRRVIGPIVSIDQFFEDMTPEERESYANGPKVLGKVEIVERENPRAICYHNPQEDAWEDGMYQCNKCGRYYA